MKLFNSLVIIVALGIIYFPWFQLFQPLVGADWTYVYAQASNQFPGGFSLYNNYLQLGYNSILLSGLNSYYQITSHFFNPLLGWAATERIFWFFPFLILSMYSSYTLTKSWLGVFVYCANTYILMIVGGGQLGIALAYSIMPLGMYYTMNWLRFASFHSFLLCTLLLALLLFFDPRFFYMAVGAGILFILFLRITQFQIHIQELPKKILFFLTPFIFVLLLHSFWILPMVWFQQNPLNGFSNAYTSSGMVKFLSFATFENALGLLHPNWPDNIFGKISFMRSEFLLFPILAFTSFLFIEKEPRRNKIQILYFSFLGLVGIFLAKGANNPYGAIYVWFFTHIPGFTLFRDPTKWYVYIALAYSFLIPITVQSVLEKMKNHSALIPFIIPGVLSIFFVTDLPAFHQRLNGTFHGSQIPKSYLEMVDFLNKDRQFSRVLWVPANTQFSFYSSTHPLVSAETFFTTPGISGVIKKLQYSSTEKLLQESGVKYVIIPQDNNSEIFLTDRKYDRKIYQMTVNALKHVPWLEPVTTFGDNVIFKIPVTHDHFWLNSDSGNLVYKSLNESTYRVDVTAGTKQNAALIFSENWDPNWQARDLDSGKILNHFPYHTIFNGFQLTHSGRLRIGISYEQTRIASIGLLISGVTLMGIVGILLMSKFMRE